MLAESVGPTVPALTPEDIVRDVKHLPSAPKVLPRLKQLLVDPNSSMREIVTLIRLDPAIAARVLQVGNSAYYSAGTRCFTVDEAVNRVGYEQVYQLVSYAVASQVLVRPLKVYGIEADVVWTLSVSCALAAETLAARSGQDREEAYTVGLLHSLGMVAIDEWALRHRPELHLRNEGFPREALESERAEFGFTQAETGAALLRAWAFPASMSDPVRWQYAPRSCATHTRMACLLHCAKWIRSVVVAPEAKRPPMPSKAALQTTGLRASDLPTIVEEVETRLREVSSLLVVTAPVRPAARFPADLSERG